MLIPFGQARCALVFGECAEGRRGIPLKATMRLRAGAPSPNALWRALACVVCGCRAPLPAAVPAGHAQDSELRGEETFAASGKGRALPEQRQAGKNWSSRQVHSCRAYFLLLFLSFYFLPMNKSGKPLDLGLVSLCSMNSNR